MSVGAVGGVGMGGAGAMSAGAAAGPSAAGATGANSTGALTPAAGNAESNPVTSVDDLNLPAEVQQDFNSIDLLIALLLMAAAQGKKDDDKSAGSTALGFLAGLAMAGALGQIDLQFNFSAESAVEAISPDDAVGGQLNITA